MKNPNIAPIGYSVVAAFVLSKKRRKNKVLLIKRGKGTELGGMVALLGGMVALQEVPGAVGTAALKSAPSQYPETLAEALARQLAEELPHMFGHCQAELGAYLALGNMVPIGIIQRRPEGMPQWVKAAGGSHTLNLHFAVPFPTHLANPEALGSSSEVAKAFWATDNKVRRTYSRFAFPPEANSALRAIREIAA